MVVSAPRERDERRGGWRIGHTWGGGELQATGLAVLLIMGIRDYFGLGFVLCHCWYGVCSWILLWWLIAVCGYSFIPPRALQLQPHLPPATLSTSLQLNLSLFFSVPYSTPVTQLLLSSSTPIAQPPVMTSASPPLGCIPRLPPATDTPNLVLSLARCSLPTPVRIAR